MRAFATGNVVKKESVARRAFEGLFAHGLPDDPQLAATLRSVGYDPEHPQEAYTPAVFKAAVEAARAHVFADLPREEGLRRMGHAFIRGFSQTVVGAILYRAARLLGPERALSRVPSYFKVVRTDVQTLVLPIADRHWRLTFAAEDHLPPFVVGCVEAMVRLSGVEAVAEVTEVTPARYSIEVHW